MEGGEVTETRTVPRAALFSWSAEPAGWRGSAPALNPLVGGEDSYKHVRMTTESWVCSLHGFSQPERAAHSHIRHLGLAEVSVSHSRGQSGSGERKLAGPRRPAS